MEIISTDLIARYTSKNITFLGIDARITLGFFILFFLFISSWTFYLFLASMIFGWLLMFLKYDVVDFFIKAKENILIFKNIMTDRSNIKKIRY
jgi:hypothetical protein